MRKDNRQLYRRYKPEYQYNMLPANITLCRPCFYEDYFLFKVNI